MHKELLEDIGEKELINRLGKFMPKNQISDDCALIKTKNENLLVNTDSLVENVHFNDITICPRDLGWKAVVSNISDLLSSGSKKTIGITISLVLPVRTEWIWVEEVYKGINKALKEYGGLILGGDCSKGNEKIISITAFGIQGELELRRNACKPGDIILTTGIHGLSKLGFLIQKEYDPSVFFLPIDFLYLVLLGVIIGIFAELYSRYVLLMQDLGKRWYKNKFVLKMSICGLILGTIYSFLPSTFHNLDELQKIIAEQNTSIGIALLAVLVLFITTGLAAASGAPGGLFYPMLTLGGAIGLIMGSWVEIATGHAPSTYIFAGMGAFVAGCSRTPITAMFLAFALTKNLLIMKPVLISCIASFLVARAFNEESIYERQIQIELED